MSLRLLFCLLFIRLAVESNHLVSFTSQNSQYFKIRIAVFFSERYLQAYWFDTKLDLSNPYGVLDKCSCP